MTLLGWPAWAVLTLIGACAAGLALFHLLRIRRPQVRVVTTLFWSEAIEAAPARALFHQFRHPRTYAFLLLIAALLALALGQPEPTSRAAQRATTVIVLDAGMSLAAPAATSGDTRWSAAQAAAIAAANRASSISALAVLVADPQPRVLLSYDEPHCLLAARLQTARPAAQPAARASAMRLAASLLRGRPQPQILLVTDRPLATDETPARLDVPWHTVPVGSPAANAAIVGAVFTPDETDPLRGHLTARVAHWGAPSVDITLQIRTDATVLLRQTATLAPGATQDFTLADLAADGRELTLQLEPADAVPADSTARFRLPLRRPIRAALPADAPACLRAMLTSDPAVRIVAPGTPTDVEVRDSGAPADASGNRPAIIVHTAGRDVAAGTALETGPAGALLANLDFAGATCAAGPALPTADPATITLLQAGTSALATWNPAAQPPRLDLSLALLDPEAPVTRQPAFAVLLIRALHQLAGWDDERLTLPTERIDNDPGWPPVASTPQALQPLAGSRHASDVAQPLPTTGSAPSAAHGRAAPAWFEIALVLAGSLLLVEALLHMRGRIV
jgi:hypothetical protein